MRQAMKAPNSIDEEVGAKIRSIRLQIPMSQETLAGQIGTTFQQLQKYEKGRNRVSASRLVMIAKALGVPAASLLPDEDRRPARHRKPITPPA